MSAEKNTPNWQTFTDTKVKGHVLSWLQENGWDIKKQTFYNHCGAGKCRKNRSGVYTKAMVKKYAEAELIHSAVGETVDESNLSLAAEKTQAEIDRIKTAASHEMLKLEILQGKHIELDRMERELASRAVVLDQGLEFFFRSKVDEMVALVGGVADKSPLLLELCLREKDAQINRFARMDNFTIMVRDED